MTTYDYAHPPKATNTYPHEVFQRLAQLVLMRMRSCERSLCAWNSATHATCAALLLGTQLIESAAIWWLHVDASHETLMCVRIIQKPTIMY